MHSDIAPYIGEGKVADYIPALAKIDRNFTLNKVYVADFTHPLRAETVALKILSDNGPVHLLINVAGVTPDAKRFVDTPLGDYNRLIDINVVGPLMFSRPMWPSPVSP